MAKSTRLIDPQGRVILPPHIRKALNLQPGNLVSIELDEGGTIKIRAAEDRCCTCGEGLKDRPFIQLTTGPYRKLLCKYCAESVAKELLK